MAVDQPNAVAAENEATTMGLTCNIDRKGKKRRSRLAHLTMVLAVGATLFMNYRGITDLFTRLVLLPLFLTSAVIFAEVKSETCIIHAAVGTFEDSSDKNSRFKKIKGMQRVLGMRMRGLGVVVVGTLAGIILGGFAYLSLFLSARTTSTTMSVFLDV